MEAALEWVLLLALGGSGLCMLGLVTMLIVAKYRMHRNRMNSGELKQSG
jgi:hypothetical protein